MWLLVVGEVGDGNVVHCVQVHRKRGCIVEVVNRVRVHHMRVGGDDLAGVDVFGAWGRTLQ